MNTEMQYANQEANALQELQYLNSILSGSLWESEVVGVLVLLMLLVMVANVFISDCIRSTVYK